MNYRPLLDEIFEEVKPWLGKGYDAVGDFAFRVGMPGKSGVGGGFVAVIPNRLSVAVWPPGINANGDSLPGTLALELFTTKTGISIF